MADSPLSAAFLRDLTGLALCSKQYGSHQDLLRGLREAESPPNPTGFSRSIAAHRRTAAKVRKRGSVRTKQRPRTQESGRESLPALSPSPRRTSPSPLPRSTGRSPKTVGYARPSLPKLHTAPEDSLHGALPAAIPSPDRRQSRLDMEFRQSKSPAQLLQAVTPHAKPRLFSPIVADRAFTFSRQPSPGGHAGASLPASTRAPDTSDDDDLSFLDSESSGEDESAFGSGSFSWRGPAGEYGVFMDPMVRRKPKSKKGARREESPLKLGMRRQSVDAFVPDKTPRDAFDLSLVAQKQRYFAAYRGLSANKAYPKDSQASASMTLLSAYQPAGMVPEPIGLLRTNERALDLTGYGIGDKFGAALAAGATKMAALHSVFLRDNRLHGAVFGRLLSNLNLKALLQLDVGHNAIGAAGCAALCDALQATQPPLEYLNVEQNALRDASMAQLFHALHACPHLETLVVRNNEVGAAAAVALSVLLGGIATAGEHKDATLAGLSRDAAATVSRSKPHTALSGLDVAWCGLTPATALRLYPGLAANASVATLDVSWNRVGSSGAVTPAAAAPSLQALCHFVASNKTVTHLDISNCGFTIEDASLLGAAFEHNQTCLGLHVEGNAMRMDAQGFVHAMDPRKVIVREEYVPPPPAPEGEVEAVKPETPAAETRPPTAASKALSGSRPGTSDTARPSWMTGRPDTRGSVAETEAYMAMSTSFETAPTLDDGSDTVLPLQRRVVALQTPYNSLPSRHAGSDVPAASPPSSKAPTPALHPSPPRHAFASAAVTLPTQKCWLCSQWRPFTFRWRAPMSGPIARESVVVRLDVEGWQEAPLTPQPDGTWTLTRMVPRSRVHFLFEVDGVTRIAEDERFVPTANSSRTTIEVLTSLLSTDTNVYDAEGYLQWQPAQFVNFVLSVDEEEGRQAAARAEQLRRHRAHSAVLKTAAWTIGRMVAGRGDGKDAAPAESFATLTGLSVKIPSHSTLPGRAPIRSPPASTKAEPAVVPRPPRADLGKPPAAPERKAWRVQDSVFGAYRGDTEAALGKAFALDWESSKLERLLKTPEEMEGVQGLLRQFFQQFKNVFRHYACKGSMTDSGNVQWGSFTEFCQTVGVMDDQVLLSHVDTVFIAVNVAKSAHKMNPDRSLCRYEFMEALVRLAHAKYVVTGKLPTTTAACEHFFPDVARLAEQDFDADRWRRRKLWTEKNDLVLKHYMPLLEVLFSSFAGQFTTYLSNRRIQNHTLMCILDFVAMFQFSGLTPGLVSERDVCLAFTHAIQPLVDDLNSEGKNMLMGKLGRVAKAVDRFPSLTRNLVFVVDAVTALADPTSTNYLPPQEIRRMCANSSSISRQDGDRKPSTAKLLAASLAAAASPTSSTSDVPSTAELPPTPSPQ